MIFQSPLPQSGTGNTHTNTTLDTLNFNPQTAYRGGSILKGQYVQIGGGGHAPDIIASVTSSTAVTLLTATSSTLTGTAVTVFNYPILIGGEASALTPGSAVTSSYWNNTGIFTSQHIDGGNQGDVWFMSGGAFTPPLGALLNGWFLPTIDGGTTFETPTIATPSTTVPAVSRDPDFVIPLDNAAYAAGNVRYSRGRYAIPLPSAVSSSSSAFKVRVQYWSPSANMPSTWMIALQPWY